MMKKFIVISKINSRDYMTKVDSSSLLAAEHLILDRAYCGLHEYGVESCMAYDEEGMKTDTFVYSALNARTVSLTELYTIIEKNNERIISQDKKERRIREINKEIEKLKAELEGLNNE